MKSPTAVWFAVAFAIAMSHSLFAADDYVEDRPLAPREDEISKWWAQSWHRGDIVTTKAQYQITGTIMITPEVKWYTFWRKWVEYDHKADIRGVSTYHSDVISGGDLKKKEPVQLLRTYECPISTRATDIVGLKNGLDIEKDIRLKYEKWYELSQEPETKQFLEDAYNTGKIILQAVVGASVGTAITSSSAGIGVPAAGTIALAAGKLTGSGLDMLKGWATRGAEDFHRKNIEKLSGGDFDADGGVEAKARGWFYKNINGGVANETGNWATTINSNFDGKTFYIAGAIGDDLVTRHLSHDEHDPNKGNDAWNVFLANANDTAKLYSTMIEETEETAGEKTACDIIKRETININESLFGCKERKVGEVWETDAKILDGYLHADLEGGFDGVMFVKYDCNESIPLTLFKSEKPIRTRKIKMIRNYHGRDSHVRYSEPSGFEVKYGSNVDDTDAEIVFWVDEKTGYIVKVRCEFKGRMNGLPHTRLSHGLKFRENSGDVEFSMSAECGVESALPRK